MVSVSVTEACLHALNSCSGFLWWWAVMWKTISSSNWFWSLFYHSNRNSTWGLEYLLLTSGAQWSCILCSGVVFCVWLRRLLIFFFLLKLSMRFLNLLWSRALWFQREDPWKITYIKLWNSFLHLTSSHIAQVPTTLGATSRLSYPHP